MWKVLETRLNGKTIIKAINTYAVSVVNRAIRQLQEESTAWPVY